MIFINTNFTKSAHLLETYRDTSGGKYKIEELDLLNEAIAKLKLLDLIIKQLKHDEKKQREFDQKNLYILFTSKTLPEKYFVTIYTQRIEIYTYSFYYLAFRIYDILRDVGLKIQAKEIISVRNHLMEHPEGKDSRIFSNGFGYIGPYGPVVKPGRNQNEKQIHLDKGLYYNARVFEKNLLKQLAA